MMDSSAPGILIVDDNPFNRELISEMAKIQGYSVTEAENGYTALEMMKKNPFALVMMDLLMPGLDGFETTRKIREIDKDIPVIAVSALTMKDDREKSLKAGCNDFLSKPVDLAALKILLKKYAAQTHEKKEPQHSRNGTGSDRMPDADIEDVFMLLVEEDENWRKRNKQFFTRSGFRVKSFANGSRAMEYLTTRGQNVQVIISNIFTSGIDGLGLLANVKRQFSHILVFLYTKDYDAALFQYAVQQKVDGILPRKQLETTALDIIRSALYIAGQKGSRVSDARTSDQVRKAQKSLIRPGCRTLCPMMDVAFQPLHEAGGDMMQCRRFGQTGQCGIMTADVAGHDVMSSYTSAIFTGLVMSAWDRHNQPSDLLKEIDRELLASGNDQSHICATAIWWDRWSGSINFTCAGNPGGLLVAARPDGRLNFRELAGGGMVLGAIKDHDLFQSGRETLASGSFLFLFSDGLEASELIRVIRRQPDLLARESATGLCRDLVDAILAKRGQTDDMILVCLNQDGTAKLDGDVSSYPSTYEAVDLACDRVAKYLASFDLPDGIDMDFLLLATREALLNAVEHGNDRNPHAHFEIEVSLKQDQVNITVTDEGSGFDLEKNMRPPETLTVEQIGKRGLSLMGTAAHDIVVKNGAVTLIFSA